jgi:hypothetical protein
MMEILNKQEVMGKFDSNIALLIIIRINEMAIFWELLNFYYRSAPRLKQK